MYITLPHTYNTWLEFSSLLPDTDYCYTIIAHGDSGDSLKSSITVRTKKLPAIPPSNLNSSPTENSIRVTWSAAPYADTYTAELFLGPTLKETKLPTASTSQTFTGLIPNTTYTVKVSTKNTAGIISTIKSEISVKTLEGIPSTPSGFRITGTTDSSVSLSWDSMIHATGYKIDVYSGNTLVRSEPTSYTKITINNLNSNTSYSFKISAHNGANKYSATSVSYATTSLGLPLAPTNLRTTSVTDDSVSLSWSASANANSYRVEVYSAGRLITSQTTTATTIEINNLTPNTRYVFNVYALNNADASTFTAVFANTDSSSEQNPASTNTRMQISLPKYRESKYVPIEGEIKEYRRGVPIEIIIEKPDGSNESIGVSAKNTGEYETQLRLTHDSQPGNYIVKIKYNDNVIDSFTVEIISEKVPDWIKTNAKWWGEKQIDDATFVSGIEYLIKEKVIHVSGNPLSSGVYKKEIPSWIRNNAIWWADDLISENDFVSGIEYLIENNIIQLN